MNATVLKEISQAPIVPTVFPLPPDILREYARVLYEESFPALEILARPPRQALQAMRGINTQPERQLIRWGIGTIVSEQVARQAADLRPDFLVSPAFSRRVLQVAVEEDIPYIPAVRTFQDVQDVLDAFEERDLKVQLLKLCPVAGLEAEYLTMLASCYPDIAFCPTGEVTLATLPVWKRHACIAAPMGSQFIPQKLLERGEFDQVRAILRQIREVSDISRTESHTCTT